MRPRLPIALACALLSTAAAGCRVDGGGLSGKIGAPSEGDEPVTPGSVGDETPKPPKSDQPHPTTSPDAARPATSPAGNDAGATTTADADKTPPPDASPASALPPECQQPLSLPLTASFHRDVPDSDDLTFDHDGYLLVRDNRDLMRMTYGGSPQMLIRNAVQGRSTIDSFRVLSGGDVVIADYQGDALTRVSTSGGQARKLADLHSPNKLTIGPGGRIYTVGLEGDVYVSDPDSGKTMQIAHVDGRLRGLTFSLDYKTLYASDARNGQIHAIGLRDDGGYESPQVWVRNIGPGPDGMTTDACGNIYVADHTNASLRRISPEGDVQVLATLSNGPTSAVEFGSGQQWWDAKTLYTVNADHGGLYEIKVGIAAAPPPSP